MSSIWCRHLGTGQRGGGTGETTLDYTVDSLQYIVHCTMYIVQYPKANRLCLVKVCGGDYGIKRETRAAFLELWVGIFIFTAHNLLFTVHYILHIVQPIGYIVHCTMLHVHSILYTVQTDQWCQFVGCPTPSHPHNSALHIRGIVNRTLHQNKLS